MPANYSRVHRLLKILMFIQADEGWTAERLAAACGVTVRTIYRDMKMLETTGIPYFYDTQGPGYRVQRDFFMPPVQLTLDESLALIALAEDIGGGEQIPLTRAAGRAIAKVRCILPPNLRDEVEQIDRHISIRLAAAGAADGIGDVYEAVRKALRRRRALRCSYDSPGGVARATAGKANGARSRASADFLFEPYTLMFNQRAWYAVGRHSGHEAVRCLKLNRFTSLSPTSVRYSIPADFSLEQHLGGAWRMIRGERVYRIELEFDAPFAETIAETQWHATQEVEWRPDGSIVFRCAVEGLDEIVWWVLSMGPHCVVRKPVELARRVRDLARGIVKRYSSGPGKRSKSSARGGRAGSLQSPQWMSAFSSRA